MASGALLKNPAAGRFLIIILTGFIIFSAFYVSPWEDADDWETFYFAGKRLIVADTPLYGTLITENFYSNPPWLAAALIPLTLFPPKLGWALLCVGTLSLAMVLLRRWNPSPGMVKIFTALSSPPMLYILLHGQIDVIIISAVLLPSWFWPLAAITKPQVAVGLVLGVPRRNWLHAGLFTGAVFGISFVMWGFWPTELVQQATPFVGAGHNLWAGLWPFQVPLGVILILVGLSRSDERFLIAGSPFLSPYAAISTMIGPWIAATSFLKPWQVVVVWLSWWGAVVYRLFA